MLEVFVDVILPVFLVAAVGGAVGRRLGFDLQTFSAAVFWLFSPALAYRGIAGVDVAGGELARVIAVAAVVFVTNLAVAQVTARARGKDDRGVASASLAGSLANQGNLGLPLARLAFGAPGLEVATVVWVTNLVLANSLGVAVASIGRVPLRRLGTTPLRYPTLYAAVAGVVVNATNVDVPTPLAESAATLGDAAIPCMLVVLGLQFHRPSRGDLVDPAIASVNRLLIGPLVAWGVVAAVGLEGVPADVSIMAAGMPTAVMVTILAAQLDARPADAVRAVVVSTLASLVTLTCLIALLR